MSDLDVKIQDVANYWDYNMPMMAMEELAEAIQAISKVERANDEYVRAEGTDNQEVANAAWRIVERRMDELKDEIRDVYISLKALMYRYNIENDIMERVEEKLNKKYKED